MAGMEQLEVHSKSYLVRWVNVPAGHTISWSIQPHRKSLNFGIFKHPGAHGGATPNLPSSATFEAPSTPALEVPHTRPRGSSNVVSRNDKSWVVEKLLGIGLKQVAWAGKCEADKVSVGKFDVPEEEGGMYGLVFDNTFSKTVSKTATFVLMTYPTNAPPKSGHMQYAQAFTGGSTSSLTSRTSPALQARNESTDSLPQDASLGKKLNAEIRPKTAQPPDEAHSVASAFYTGVLQKKRRKRNQGYARRFFSLDFTSSTLSYYRNNHSSALRGAIPLSLAAIGANEKSREISVDSGAEVWHLRANNKKDFEMWRDALERASRTAGGLSPTRLIIQDKPWPDTSHVLNDAEESEWQRVEALVGRVAGTRDAVRRLAQDTDPKYQPTVPGLGIGRLAENISPSPTDSEPTDYSIDQEKGSDRIPFWKRKPSSTGASPSALFKRSVSAQLAVASPLAMPSITPPLPNGNLVVPKKHHWSSSNHPPHEEGVHDHCMALLRDLDTVVEEFSTLLTESRKRRAPAALPSTPRKSMDSQSSDEFFDANDGDTIRSQFLKIRRDSDESVERYDISDGESESSSEAEGIGSFDRKFREGQPSIFPSKPKSLTPLPLDRVKRRTTVPTSKGPPPSLIGFLRKNVGKDLSTISMPVSANEPTSLLQRLAEQMEYSELLDAAATSPSNNGERLAHIAAFAISAFSISRIKERAIRKPFNPMLGETFELVREDKGFRFVSEKVSHHPVRMACQAESQHWTFIQSPMPVQKFWGKSAELNTDGRARVFLHATNEHYSWTIATSFLRNIIAGEKYVEPVGTMTIINENTGSKAVCTFKAGGMFAGRSEDVSVQIFDAQGGLLPLGLQGKWTSELHLSLNGQNTRTLWAAGALVENSPQRYGFTTFAASLNQITDIEKGRIPITDSRLRPDQRAAEDGDLDRAEAIKARLEERQRARRRVMEEHGEAWCPRWFVKVESEGEGSGLDGGEEVWRLRSGRDGYWDERARGEWTEVMDVFQV
ncbi:hypothetical protein K432DRAFT_427831 [Lepidopterella palustris CBS 459.81]|uniref:PH domain-containing protein n=1 Tax=Lepidopterella palustris CBS 459.81 TaxID=1314670 RepID=A0A8E2JCS8_9PEZI|nr:hypothetical protein K432DRAFT_427831 [Lepidopterella palustris CBS 459.81]